MEGPSLDGAALSAMRDSLSTAGILAFKMFSRPESLPVEYFEIMREQRLTQNRSEMRLIECQRVLAELLCNLLRRQGLAEVISLDFFTVVQTQK